MLLGIKGWPGTPAAGCEEETNVRCDHRTERWTNTYIEVDLLSHPHTWSGAGRIPRRHEWLQGEKVVRLLWLEQGGKGANRGDRDCDRSWEGTWACVCTRDHMDMDFTYLVLYHLTMRVRRLRVQGRLRDWLLGW